MKQKEIIERVKSGEYCILHEDSYRNYINVIKESDATAVAWLSKRQLQSLLDKNLIKSNRIDYFLWSKMMYTARGIKIYYVWNDDNDAR